MNKPACKLLTVGTRIRTHANPYSRLYGLSATVTNLTYVTYDKISLALLRQSNIN
jgi:hypothetical protein